jgi:hypothetical protein
MRRSLAVASVLMVLAGLGGSASASAREPIEGLWLSESGYVNTVQVVPIGLGQFKGKVITVEPNYPCPGEPGRDAWLLGGSGLSYGGLITWAESLLCTSTGMGQATWQVTPDERRMRLCSAPPFAGPPTLDPSGNPTGGTQCFQFVRLGIGAALGARRICSRYEVVGVRGSGEPLAGPFEMGDTVGRTAARMLRGLPDRRVRMLSLPYPAAPVSDLLRDGGAPFFASIAQGVNLLVDYLTDLATRCPHARVAVIAYSQGAAVASEAMRTVRGRARSQVRAVLLYADPYSAGHTRYAITPVTRPRTNEPRRRGHGSLGARRAAVPGATLDVCFTDDIVCDEAGGPAPLLLYQGLTASRHTKYKSCCAWYPGNETLTGQLAFQVVIKLRRWAR